MRFSHTLFNNPSRISERYDCTDGVCNSLPDPSDDCWNHGTKSAGILSGNNNLGNAFRGVTRFPVKSYKVYTCAGLSRDATRKAFEHAMQTGNTIIVAEIQDTTGETGSTSLAAESAYRAGATIIAANGNFGSNGAGSVRAPANAHGVIGVGAYYAHSLNQYLGQGLGPTTDGRIKPDIQTPTWTRTASSSSDSDTGVFAGTSGATPYAAAAAAVARSWYFPTQNSTDPGRIYSLLILWGSVTDFDNTVGAGRLRLPSGPGTVYSRKDSVEPLETFITSFEVPAGSESVSAAIWWPENHYSVHDTLSLKLRDPNGYLHDVSDHSTSVFQKVRTTRSTIPSGTWKLEISDLGPTERSLVLANTFYTGIYIDR